MTTYWYIGPSKSLISSSALALNPSFPKTAAYRTNQCRYSSFESSNSAALIRFSRCAISIASFHHSGLSSSAIGRPVQASWMPASISASGPAGSVRARRGSEIRLRSISQLEQTHVHSDRAMSKRYAAGSVVTRIGTPFGRRSTSDTSMGGECRATEKDEVSRR